MEYKQAFEHIYNNTQQVKEFNYRLLLLLL